MRVTRYILVAVLGILLGFWLRGHPDPVPPISIPANPTTLQASGVSGADSSPTRELAPPIVQAAPVDSTEYLASVPWQTCTLTGRLLAPDGSVASDTGLFAQVRYEQARCSEYLTTSSEGEFEFEIHGAVPFNET